MSNNAVHILYIDDDDGIRRLVERALSRRGYRVSTAASGDDGLERIDRERFDLVVIDHYMPGQDGLETLRKLRQRSDPPPVVYVTGSDETRIAVAALKAGASDYVVKAVGDDFFDLLCSSFEQALAKVRLAEARIAAERDLRESNARLEAMLGEVHHRVANSLQLVSAFVSMQTAAASSDEAREALAATQTRIEAIGQVHRRLYTSEHHDEISLDEYLEHLVDELRRSIERPGLSLSLTTEPLVVKPDRAISVGIIASELVSNAAKYAYPETLAGEVRISMRKAERNSFCVRVEDDGIGVTPSSLPKGTGLGMRLIDAMARSMDGTVKRDQHARGASFTLRAQTS